MLETLPTKVLKGNLGWGDATALAAATRTNRRPKETPKAALFGW
jgi:hypothetical protein